MYERGFIKQVTTQTLSAQEEQVDPISFFVLTEQPPHPNNLVRDLPNLAISITGNSMTSKQVNANVPKVIENRGKFCDSFSLIQKTWKSCRYFQHEHLDANILVFTFHQLPICLIFKISYTWKACSYMYMYRSLKNSLQSPKKLLTWLCLKSTIIQWLFHVFQL